MNFLSNRFVALALWVLPLLLLVISISLLRAGIEQRHVAETGETVTAEVLAIETHERSEIARGHATLRYTPTGAAQAVTRDIELPMTFLKDLELQPEPREVNLRVIGEGGQVVLEPHLRSQWVLTFSFAAMALMGAIGFGWMVGAWNRYLARHGDPAEVAEGF